MKPTYAFRNLAVRGFRVFLEEDFVYDFFAFFQSEGDFRRSVFMGKEWYQRKVDDDLTHFSRALEDFENEIIQVSLTSTQGAINFYFEELNELMKWVTVVDSEKLRLQFEEWNSQKIDEHSAKVESESSQYFQEENRQRPHLEKHMERQGGISGFLTLAGSLSPSYREVTNYNFYCIESVPDILDMFYFPIYISLVNRLKTKLDTLVEKYMDMYRRNKIISGAQVQFGNITVSQPMLPGENTSTMKALLPANQPCKINFDGTPEEFVEMFAPLIEKRKLFLHHKKRPDTQPIAKLLYQAFEIHQVGKSTEISENTLVSYFKKHFADKK